MINLFWRVIDYKVCGFFNIVFGDEGFLKLVERKKLYGRGDKVYEVKNGKFI